MRISIISVVLSNPPLRSEYANIHHFTSTIQPSVKYTEYAGLYLVAQLCPSLCDAMDCILPGSSVHGILQARILEWVAILFSRGSSQPRD